MTAPAERTGTAPGGEFRIWEMGQGRPTGFFAGLLGLPRWLPFLDTLAETRKVVAPSLPGTPGGHDWEMLDDHLDWVLAALDAWHCAGLDGGDLIGASSGAALAAEVAAIHPGTVRRLVLIGPLGVFDAQDPIPDVFAQRPGMYAPLVSNTPQAVEAYVAADPAMGDDAVVEWDITQQRARNAAARFLWPLCDTRLIKRLGRVTCPTLLLRGADDRVVPESYFQHFAEAISGPVAMEIIPGAGHMAELDTPEAVATIVSSFLDRG